MSSSVPAALPRVLTGITTTGTPHLGNYAGAIRPAIEASRDPGVQSFYFLANYHGLIKCPEPDRIQRSTLEIAATWLAAGLDPERVFFYRQSDVPEIPELCWYLTCVTAKGLLNRAHAYKAANDRNREAGLDLDAEVTAGLYMYPVLMAADILIFRANRVPVGADQVQHLEIARDIAQRFNHLYGEILTLPQVQVDESVGTLPGLDGRKMSKSYDNTIPLFCSERELEKLIAGIVTDSRRPGEPKDADASALYQLYQAFASADESAAFRQALLEGMGWGDAKKQLAAYLNKTLAPMREQYERLIARPDDIEDILLAGAAKARADAAPLMQAVRDAVGIRSLRPSAASGPATQRTAGAGGIASGVAPEGATLAGGAAAGGKGRAATTPKAARPILKQYREADGRFYFKLLDADGTLCLQSLGFENPRECAACIQSLKDQPDAWQSLQPRLEAVDAAQVARIADVLRQLTAE
ncbi:MAG: tryptophan--tRNA ligase [Lautropia sp.]|nr:tryptophan--tRNA ligase [Lautropia sp.]